MPPVTVEWIRPDWPAPPRVRAGFTTRLGGVSAPPYHALNLGDHVGDDPAAVDENRRRLTEALALPAVPRWLNQVHGCRVVSAGEVTAGCEADASFTRVPGVVCAVLTADCLPLLLCDREGEGVAAVHAGWRGLADGVVEAAVRRLGLPPERLLAWLGPAIGPERFEVGDEVYRRFVQAHPEARAAFRPAAGRWLADIYTLARLRLRHCGVEAVFGGDRCTFTEHELFFSYRRDGVTGRMAAVIWLE